VNLKNIFLLVFFGVIISANAIGSGRDGAWWSTLDTTQKAFYIVGMTDGVMLGLSALTMNCYTENYKSKPDTSECISGYTADFAPGFNKLGFTRREPANLIIGINTIYSDYRNVNIPVSNVLVHVLRGMNGDADLDEVLESLRKSY